MTLPLIDRTLIGGDGVSRTHNARGRRIYSPLGLPIFLHLQKWYSVRESNPSFQIESLAT